MVGCSQCSHFDMVINFSVMAASCTRAGLKSCVDDEYSLIKTCHETVHVPLPPAYVGSEAKGIRTLLESWKGQYVERCVACVSPDDVCGSSMPYSGSMPFIKYATLKGSKQTFLPERR